MDVEKTKLNVSRRERSAMSRAVYKSRKRKFDNISNGKSHIAPFYVEYYSSQII